MKLMKKILKKAKVGISQEIWCSNRETRSFDEKTWRFLGKLGALAGMTYAPVILNHSHVHVFTLNASESQRTLQSLKPKWAGEQFQLSHHDKSSLCN